MGGAWISGPAELWLFERWSLDVPYQELEYTSLGVTTNIFIVPSYVSTLAAVKGTQTTRYSHGSDNYLQLIDLQNGSFLRTLLSPAVLSEINGVKQ